MGKPLPEMLMFGFECEVSRGACALAERLHSLGMLPDDYLHEYHCRCSTCTPDPDRSNFLHAQDDCTVAGEFISRPLYWQRDDTHEGIATLSRAAVAERASADRNAGCHVHVSAGHLSDTDRVNVLRVVGAFDTDFEMYAGGKAKEVRSYNAFNGKPDADRWDDDRQFYRGGHTSWVDVTRHPTIEFRLWNGTVTDWRIRMYAAISLATVSAVMDGKRPAHKPDQHLHDFLADYLPGDGAELMARQRDYVCNA